MIVAVFNKLADPVKKGQNLDPSIFVNTLRRYLTNATPRLKLRNAPKKRKRQLSDTDDTQESESLLANEKYDLN
jgi:hypothetical protein